MSKPKVLQVYIGVEPRQQDAFRVAYHSLVENASVPVHVTPIHLERNQRWGTANRPIEWRDGRMWDVRSEAPQATEFAITRFLAPILGQTGWSLFIDCDVMFRADVAELFALADDRYAAMCVQHEQKNEPGFKMDGQIQTSYSRKNWSSVCLWNSDHRANLELTLDKVLYWAGRQLHGFDWLDDHQIGALPPDWNYLVGVTQPLLFPKLVHFTLGCPDVPGYEECEYSDEWRAYLRSAVVDD